MGFGSYQGRYGSDGVLSTSVINPLCLNEWFQYGASRGLDYWDFTNPSYSANNAGSFGSPPDPFGVGMVGLDQAGRPLYVGMKYNGTDYVGFGSGLVGLPYQLNLAPNAPHGASTSTSDNPFSPTELERLLRPFDRDATSLPGRLAALTSPGGVPETSVLITQPRLRKAFTTESWDVPCPAVPTTRQVTALLAARGIPASVWPQLLPPDLLAGLKMNINRPFGNGQASGNEVVDDPTVTTPQQVRLYKTATIAKNYNMSFDGGVGLAANSLEARQLEARYLYVLMCLTCDLDYLQKPAQLGSSAEVARSLAQWAVNVVDFQDRDSIMTPFDYDPTFADPAATPTGWTPTQRVWGCERPQLLITETLAFHDRRTQDLDSEAVDPRENDGQDDPGKTTSPTEDHPHNPRDASFDQKYKPQGSLFVELYNPSSPMQPHSGDLYDGPNGGLLLTQVTPKAGPLDPVWPVWRMLIAKPQGYASKKPVAEQPDPDSSERGARRPDVEREVYFVSQKAVDGSVVSLPPESATGAGVQFRPMATRTVSIRPGTYAVIGPRADDSNPDYARYRDRTYIGCLDDGAYTRNSSTRHIDLVDGTRGLVQGNDDPLYSTTAAPVVTLAIDSPRRLSVTEPVNGYSGPNFANGEFTPPLDIPLDNALVRTDGESENLTLDHTIPAYRVIYLQRLANPLLPYNNNSTSPTYNPYRTVDMMSVDMSSFNGFEKKEPGADNRDGSFSHVHFQARQRGEKNDGSVAGLNETMNLWKQEPVDKVLTGDAPGTIANQVFNRPLKHSLGYLNVTAFGAPQAALYTGAPAGDPAHPFPWLTWNNRPWVSPLELLMVPALSSSKLLVNAAANTSTPGLDNPDYNKYFDILRAVDPTPNPYSVNTLFGAGVPYPHLLNFFQSDKTTLPGTSAQFQRILDYLDVPSPFVGAELQANPTEADSTGHTFRPPFNRISTYREPGRINLNTIYSQQVFNGLMNGYTTPTWQEFVGSRQGGGATTDVLGCVAGMPTEFARPFRSSASGSLAPASMVPDHEVDATLLREGSTSGTPLFQYDGVSDATSPTGLREVDDPRQSPYFRYQALQRLGNLVTTRSNVYAVWITVGYFEVTHLTPPYDTTIYPDGYQLGRELGSDTGDIQRHRAFYIIDRTLPVGFQRGQDLNVDKAFLVKRYIE